MQEEKQGEERTLEEKALEAQHKADLEHLLKNTHPSLHNSVSIGDASNGTCQSLSDYSVLTFKEQIAALQEEVQFLKNELESLRLRVVPEATPPTPEEEQ